MKDFVLVVSGYAADLAWLERIQIPFIVYNKGASHQENAIALPNVGRESHTYLYHIVENYTSLPEWSIFSQDNPFPHSSQFVDRVNALSREALLEDFTNLCNGVVTNNGSGEPDHSGLKLSEYYHQLFGEERSSFTFGPGAQFVVRRRAILSREIEFYQRAMDLVLTAPEGPWLLERYWPYVFGSEGAR